MQSSFKKGYEKTNNPDGSIDLSFKTQRIGAHGGSGFAGILIMAMYPVSCAVTSPAIIPFYDPRSARDGFPAGIAILWNILAFALWIWSVRKFNFQKSILTIKPNSGLVFAGKQLPFSDIQTIGTLNETTTRNAKGTAYVYANACGQKVRITKYMPLELAEAIATEIKQASGFSWGQS